MDALLYQHEDGRHAVQSHGVAGVQARRYDGHDYMAEKRKALATLHKLLTQPEARAVKPITHRRKA